MPILLIFVVAFLLIGKSKRGKTGVDGVDVSIFDPPKSVNGVSTVTTSGGTVVTGTTINVAKAKVLAEQLFGIFDAWFTYDSDVLNVLKPLNEKDFKLVFDQFGLHKRDYISPTGSAFLGSDLDLIEWIDKEVTTPASRTKLHKQFPNIF